MNTNSPLTSDGEVSEEEPPGDEGLAGVARGLAHDVQVRGVEAQGGGGQAVRHQVDPEQLDRDERLREAQGCRQEDAAQTWNTHCYTHTHMLWITLQTTHKRSENSRLLALLKMFTSNLLCW